MEAGFDGALSFSLVGLAPAGSAADQTKSPRPVVRHIMLSLGAQHFINTKTSPSLCERKLMVLGKIAKTTGRLGKCRLNFGGLSSG